MGSRGKDVWLWLRLLEKCVCVCVYVLGIGYWVCVWCVLVIVFYGCVVCIMNHVSRIMHKSLPNTDLRPNG